MAGPVTVADDQASDESCPALDTVGNGDGFLDPGGSVTCTARYTTTQAALHPASVTNEATATADGTTSNTRPPTHCANQPPVLALEESLPAGLPFDAPGDVVTYVFTVTNAASVRFARPLPDAVPIASDESCPALDTVGNGDGFLDPGESVTC